MIGIDDVYQKVLALANKEQRGYVTPQEFNLFADHAQMDIFRQYFYILDRALKTIPNNTGYADTVKMVEEKISMFEKINVESTIADENGSVLIPDSTNFYRLTMVGVEYNGSEHIAQASEVPLKELLQYADSSLIHNISKHYPYYSRFSGSSDQLRIKVYPFPEFNGDDVVYTSYVRIPKKPNWTYLMSGENALYNSSASDHQDFELHPSEETNLVIKILQLAGINIKDGSLVQLATQEEVKKIQQEN